MPRKTERRSKQGRDSRRRILDATFELANELGYQGTTIAKVSNRSGLPASSVYWHFADKDALFTEVINDSYQQWRASVPRWHPPGPDESRLENLSNTLRHGVASIVGSPAFWRLGLMLSLEHQVVEPTAKATFVEIREAVKDRMASYWRASLGPSAPPLAPRMLAEFTMATSDGLLVAAQVDVDLRLDIHARNLAIALEAIARSYESRTLAADTLVRASR